jgi:hypothetical protein
LCQDGYICVRRPLWWLSPGNSQEPNRDIPSNAHYSAGGSRGTPLTNIALAIELLRMEKNSALIDSVRRNIKDMDVLIAQFLDFARADTLETANRVSQPARARVRHGSDEPYLRHRRYNYLERCASATGKIMHVVEPWA